MTPGWSAVALGVSLALVGCRDDQRTPAWANDGTFVAPVAAPPAAAATPAAPAAAPTTAAAAADPRGAHIRGHYRKHEYLIPMRDGAKLFTAVYVPDDAGPAKRYPFLIERTPYSAAPYGAARYSDNLGPTAAFEQSGYIFVVQDVRGKGMSEGTFVDMRPHVPAKRGAAVDESSDTYDTIAWLLAHVPEHNGKAGVWGVSYPGFYAAAAAIDAHPALVAVSPQAPCTDWWLGDDMHRNGAFALQEAFTFFTRFGRVRPAPTDVEGERYWPAFPFGTTDQYAFYLGLGPLSEIDAADLGAEIPIWNDFKAHPDYDDYWRSRNHAPYLRGVRPAILTVGGFYDTENLYGALATYRAIERQGPRRGNTLVMGPWRHNRWNHDAAGDKLGDADFGFATTAPYQALLFAFFEHHLKGAAAPAVPEALVFESGANRWRRFPSWPPPGSRDGALTLGPDGTLALDGAAPAAAAPATPAPAGFDEFVSDPARPVPNTSALGTAQWPAGYMAEDQRPFARRPDVLVYQTAPLPRDVTLAGPLTASLFVSTTGTDADWIVKLIDVEPSPAAGDDPTTPSPRSGQQTLVRGEPFRGRYRDGNQTPKPFVPGEITPVTFAINDVFHTFGRGHRIMIQIQSTWFPWIDRNPQTFVPNIFAATRADFVKATHRVHFGAATPSALRVTLLPAADE